MRGGPTARRLIHRALGLAAAASLAAAGAAGAQSRGTANPQNRGAATAPAAAEPIECWWRTSPNSVRVGEFFTVVLTCEVLETATTTVVPDQSHLEPSVFQLLPFEITGGTHAADIRTTDHRFFQYGSTVRYIGEDFGKDVRLPSFSVTYRVQTRGERDAVIEGRDREYVLPALAIRVVSLFEDGAHDIRDRPPETFRGIEAAHFRASALRVTGWALLGLSIAMIAVGLARLLRQADTRVRAVVQHVSDVAILRAARRELDEVERLRHAEGWTTGLAARALVPLRIAATYALGRQVVQVAQGSQGATTSRARPSEGQLVVRSVSPRGVAVALVSGSATANAVRQELDRTGDAGGADGVDTRALASLHDALALCARAAYGRSETAPAESDLAQTLAAAVRAVEAVAHEHAGLNVLLRTLRRSASALRERAWAR